MSYYTPEQVPAGVASGASSATRVSSGLRTIKTESEISPTLFRRGVPETPATQLSSVPSISGASRSFKNPVTPPHLTSPGPASPAADSDESETHFLSDLAYKSKGFVSRYLGLHFQNHGTVIDEPLKAVEVVMKKV